MKGFIAKLRDVEAYANGYDGDIARALSEVLDEMEAAEVRLTQRDSSRALAMIAWFCSRGATGAGQWPGDPDDFAKQTKAREEFDAWWAKR